MKDAQVKRIYDVYVQEEIRQGLQLDRDPWEDLSEEEKQEWREIASKTPCDGCQQPLDEGWQQVGVAVYCAACSKPDKPQTIAYRSASLRLSFWTSTGTIAQGTGLGYYRTEEGQYILVHISSGLGVSSGYMAAREITARKWLEYCLTLTDWNQSEEALLKQASTLKPQVEGWIERYLESGKDFCDRCGSEQPEVSLHWERGRLLCQTCLPVQAQTAK